MKLQPLDLRAYAEALKERYAEALADAHWDEALDLFLVRLANGAREIQEIALTARDTYVERRIRRERQQ